MCLYKLINVINYEPEPGQPAGAYLAGAVVAQDHEPVFVRVQVTVFAVPLVRVEAALPEKVPTIVPVSDNAAVLLPLLSIPGVVCVKIFELVQPRLQAPAAALPSFRQVS